MTTSRKIQIEKDECTGQMIVYFFENLNEVGNASFNDYEFPRMTCAINEFMCTGNVRC